MIQGGAGTSSNMNANEVVANLTLRELRRPAGDYKTIHPNDHVNLLQSTNDVDPTAVRLTMIRRCPAHIAVTAINPYIGYVEASRVAKEALKSWRSVREIVLAEQLMTVAQLAEAFSTENLLGQRQSKTLH
jgi:aspartate ammonia-lyase